MKMCDTLHLHKHMLMIIRDPVGRYGLFTKGVNGWPKVWRHSLRGWMFVVEALHDQDFHLVQRAAVTQKVILFLPFRGDVERGATVGLYISSKIRPYCNLVVINQSDIRFHPLFMKLCKWFEV